MATFDSIGSTPGPDVAIVGAARSGTSFLTAHLAAHPQIDAGSVKEPNFFSRYHERGEEWYDSLFAPRSAGVLRMDASTSYTYPQYPDALDRLVATSPDAFVVYLVRDPIARAVSHYLYYHNYFRMDSSQDFGSALRADSYYADVSSYEHWLPRLRDRFGADRMLVVPFDLVTGASPDVVSVICRAVDIDPAAAAAAEHRVNAHQNNVVEFRSDRVRLAMKKVRRNRTYLRLRTAVGPHRVRFARSLFTRTAELPSVAEALASCDAEQIDQLHRLTDAARAAVNEHLVEQDSRLGLSWAPATKSFEDSLR